MDTETAKVKKDAGPAGKTKEKPLRKREPMTLRSVIAAAVLSFALSFAIFVLSPLYVIGDNQELFPMPAGEILLPVMLAGLANAVLLGGVLLLLRKFLPRVYSVISRLLAGLLIAFFLQAVFFNPDSTVMTGYRTSYSELKAATIAGTLAYLVIVLLPLILHIIAVKKPLKKRLGIADRNAVLYISAAALAVQLGWAGIKALRTDLSKYDERYYGYLSYSQAMSLSDKGNIVVFLSDRLDGDYMDAMLEKYPELNDKFSSFTYYQNNVSHSTNTFPSVAQMLTGEQYDGGEWYGYMKKAWDGDSFPEQLKANGYDINLIPDTITTVEMPRMMSGFCDNIGFYDSSEAKPNYFGEYGVIHGTAKLSFARLLPGILKGSAACGLGTYPGRQYLIPDEMPEDKIVPKLKPFTDLRYFDYLKAHGLDADHENKTFSFIHLSASHNLSSDLAELYEPVDGEADVYETTRGDFEILFYYFDEMKRLGVWDNSTVIILGDHGRPPNETDGVFNLKLKSAITTALLIKPAGSGSEPIAFDRYSELSNDYFGASVLEFAGIDHSGCGLSYNDVIENDLHPERYLQSVKFLNYGALKYTARYRITGDARDFDNWELLPEHENE